MKRTTTYLIAAAAGALVLAVIGYLVGLDLAIERMDRAGVTQVILSSPNEGRGISITTALQFAWPAIAAGVAIALHRWRIGEDPSSRRALSYFLIPALVVGGYTALQLTWMASVMGQGAATAPMPMFTLRDFGPTARDAQLLGFVSLVMWLYVWVRKR